MPAISIVTSANTMDFWRLVINQLVSNTNAMLESNFFTAGNIIITLANSQAIALNVANGYIKGNGARIFTIPNTSILTGITNAQLNTSNIVLVTSAGLEGGKTIDLGSSTTINVVPVDSTTNSRTDLAASANSIVNALAQGNTGAAANASQITIGIALETVGGTGETTYSNGQILIGNTISGGLDKSQLTVANGVTIDLAAGSIKITANLIQGGNLNLTSSGNSGITISVNGIANATTTGSYGIISLVDDFLTNSTTQGVTANAVKALSDNIATNPSIGGSTNNFGRLIESNIFIGLVGTARTFVWQKPANLNYLILTLQGGGGGGCAANPLGAGNTGNWISGTPGGAGGYLKCIIPSNLIPNSTANIVIGAASANCLQGIANSSDAESLSGFRGHSITFGNPILITISGGESGQATTGIGSFYKANGSTFDTQVSDQQGTGITVNSSIIVLAKNYSEAQGYEGGAIFGRATGMRNNAVVFVGAKARAMPGYPGSAIWTGSVAGSFGGADAFGFGHGGGGTITVSRGPGINGGNGAPGIVILEAYSNT